MSTINNRQRGKATEKAVSTLLGGRRVGLMGHDDVDTEAFSVEVKDRVKCVAFNFMAQAVRNCRDGKTPLVVIHQTHKRHDDDLVCMRMADWIDWYGQLPRVSYTSVPHKRRIAMEEI